MALRPKTAVLQMRVDPQLLTLFHECCDARNTTASAAIRIFMVNEVEAYRVYRVKEARKAQEASLAHSGAPVSSTLQKPPVGAPVKPEGDVAKRMRLKKEAKMLRSVDHDFDDE